MLLPAVVHAVYFLFAREVSEAFFGLHAVPSGYAEQSGIGLQQQQRQQQQQQREAHAAKGQMHEGSPGRPNQQQLQQARQFIGAATASELNAIFGSGRDAICNNTCFKVGIPQFELQHSHA